MNLFVWICEYGSVNLDHLLRFRFCGLVCVDRCVCTGVCCSLCEYICVDRWVWIGVREVFGSIFVDLCMCIFWVYVSVRKMFVWIGENGSGCVKCWDLFLWVRA